MNEGCATESSCTDNRDDVSKNGGKLNG